MPLTNQEQKRYNRHIILHDIRIQGQEKIKETSMLHREVAAQRIFHGYLYGVLPLLLILPVFCGGRKQKRSESEAEAESKKGASQRR